MIKKILFMMRKNSMTILGAAAIASGMFYVINNPELFVSSILSLQEQEFITQKWRDIAYKTQDGYVDIFAAEQLDTPQKIDFSVFFDPNTIQIDPQNISGQWTRSYTLPEKWNITIRSFPPTDIDKKQSLILLPFSGEAKDILLGEAKTDKKWLSIWSLNERTLHLQ